MDLCLLNEKEVLVVLDLINDYQDDGAEWTIDGVKLNSLKKKLKAEK
jgi:hypothetical protein